MGVKKKPLLCYGTSVTGSLSPMSFRKRPSCVIASLGLNASVGFSVFVTLIHVIILI